MVKPVAHAAIIRHPLSVAILFRDARRRFEKNGILAYYAYSLANKHKLYSSTEKKTIDN
jgi:hypothetical protein